MPYFVKNGTDRRAATNIWITTIPIEAKNSFMTL